MTYYCDSHRCDFNHILDAIRNDTALRNEQGTKDTCEIVMDTIANHPTSFTTNDVGGFIVYHLGKPCLLVENESIQRTSLTPFGVIELSEVRRGLFQNELKKQIIRDGILNTITSSLLCGGAFVGILKLIKKI